MFFFSSRIRHTRCYRDWSSDVCSSDLEEKHMAEVIREPGFLWAQRCRLEQRDEQGWLGYLLIYGLESREALERYMGSPARERFWRELEPFADVHHAERFYGTVDLRLEGTSPS